MTVQKRIFTALLLLLLCAAQQALCEKNTTLDLRSQPLKNAKQVLAAVDKAAKTPDTVNIDGLKLAAKDYQTLFAKRPEIDWVYSIKMFGLTVSSRDTKVDFKKTEVKDCKKLAQYLACLPKLEQVLMYDVYINKADKEMLFAQFPDIFFGWTIKIQDYRIRTDCTAFSSLKSGAPPYLRNDQLWWIKMCPNLLALDLGHNLISDISFLYDCPQIKVLILACNYIIDIKPISALKDLEYLELFKNEIVDVSPLSGLTKLMDCNLCLNRINDAKGLYDLPSLERLWITQNKNIKEAQRKVLREKYADIELVFNSAGSTGDIITENGRYLPGWREHKRYRVIHRMFNRGYYIPWDAKLD